MTKIIFKNQKTGAFEIVERHIPYPLYNIGQKVCYQDDNKQTVSGIITGMDISSHLTEGYGSFVVSILLTLDNGTVQIYEDQVDSYYDGSAIKLPDAS